MTIRMGIAGLSGRMGRLVEAEVVESAQAGFCTYAGGLSRAPDAAFARIEELAAVSDVIIDFTAAATVQPHAAALAQAGCAWVLGTTGLSAHDQAAVDAAAKKIAILQAANFSPGVNLILALAEQLAAALPADSYDAEILEMHHRQKIDAPSGTALALGRAVAAGRGQNPETSFVTSRAGHTGPRQSGQIGFATLRGGQITGSHTLLLTAATEQITLTHHAFDRAIFAKGALQAALWLHGRPAGLYGMKEVLGIK